MCSKLNKENNYNIIINQIKNLSEKDKLKLVRRGRDTFNKNKTAQLQILATMITDGLIHKDDLT